jgi:hypothetical protein
METTGDEQTQEKKKETLKKRSIIFIIIVLLGLFLCTIFYFLVTAEKKPDEESVKRSNKSTEVWKASVLHNSPEALQNSFSDDVKNGVNDQYTKADAYWITHRYSDTLGNVYEIYDYIQSRPHLMFIQKDAEMIYPKIFEKIKSREVVIGTDFARYAYLAYIEALKNHGYTDIAGIGTASNQYAKTAYFNHTIAQQTLDENFRKRALKFQKRDIKKSIEFAKLAQGDVVKILDGELTEQDMPARDILVGLNQYAAALRYRQFVGADYSSPKSADEIFKFTTEYTRKHVPELAYFTSILNASTLAILEPEDPQQIKEALYPILNLDTTKVQLLDASIVRYILNARFEQRQEEVRMADLDIYGRRNVVRLASRVHAFRLWLIANGWTDDDFR